MRSSADLRLGHNGDDAQRSFACERLSPSRCSRNRRHFMFSSFILVSGRSDRKIRSDFGD